MKKLERNRVVFFALIAAWFVINFVQAAVTLAYEDEGYYEVYANNLDWGYYDHPPMVALMIVAGHLFLGGTIGMRLFAVILSTLSCIVIWKLIDDKNADKNRILLFFILIGSLVMFNIYGFIVVPDSPLIFFSSLFLLAYKNYLDKPSWRSSFLMAFLAAAMLYSKYHAVILLGLVVLSNLKMLKDIKMWTAFIVIMLLFTPHLLWQFDHGFPSFKYHLYQRNVDFSYTYPLEYIPYQMLVFGPTTFGALIYVLIKRKPADAFEKTLYFITIGFIGFFWIMTYRGHAEPHWTVVCIIPVVILIYRHCLQDKKLTVFVRRFIFPMTVIVLIMRVLLFSTDAFEFIGFWKKQLYYGIEKVAEGRPVIFRARFQDPSLYMHYTGGEAATIECYDSHKTQYDLWAFDTLMIGREVFVRIKIDSLSPSLAKDYEFKGKKFSGFITKNFQSANRIAVTTTPLYQPEQIFHKGDTIFANILIHNQLSTPINFHHEDFPIEVKAMFKDDEDSFDIVADGFYDDIDTLRGYETIERRFYALVPDTSILWNRHKTFAVVTYDRMSIYNRTQEYFEINLDEKNK